MGVDLGVYRVRIGLFNSFKLKTTTFLLAVHGDHISIFLILLLTTILLLLSGDIEVNPGPTASLWHCNIRGLNFETHADLLSDVAHNFDILALTETFLNTNCCFDLNINGYLPIFRKDRTLRPGGGVALYVRDSLFAVRRSEFEILELEALWVEIKSSKLNLMLCVCYRTPNTGQVFRDNFQDSLDRVKQSGNANVIIIGDLNADPGYANGPKPKYFSESNILNINITSPTRITSVGATILDQILPSTSVNVTNCRVGDPFHKSDHCSIYCNTSLSCNYHDSFNRNIWDFKKADWAGLKDYLHFYDWDTCFSSEDVNVWTEQWTRAYLEICKQFIPFRSVTIRPNDKPWYCNTLRALKRKRDRLFRKFKMTKLEIDWGAYKKLRNKYAHELSKAVSDYNQKLFDSLNDCSVSEKGWWRTIRVFFSGSKQKVPTLQYADGSICTYTKDKANLLNKMFSSYSEINDSDRRPPDLDFKTGSRLQQIYLSESDVLDILKSLKINKATGPDDISPTLLKNTAEVIYKPLSRLFNKSLSSNTFPDFWKIANVVPIFKKGDSHLCNNYRPVSLLSVPGKIFEKCIFKYLFNYLRDNNLIHKMQSGFMPKDSTTNQLVFLYHTLTEALDKNKKVRVVFGDISKAFDRVWHAGLLAKLNSTGVTGDLNKWFSSYLAGRKQRVVLDNINSDFLLIKAGVPQGSVLGPLLFLLYINDIADNLQCGISLFEDDNIIFTSADTMDECTNALNKDLIEMENWAAAWLVTFSAKKTLDMVLSFHPKPVVPPPLSFMNVDIKNVVEHSHLGLTFTSNLKWSSHINNISIKANKRLTILKKLSFKITRKGLEQLYFAYIRSLLEYGDVVFANAAQNDLNKLDKIHKRGAKIVAGGIRGVSSAVLFDELSWDTLPERRNNRKLFMFSDIVHHHTPTYLHELLPNSVHTRSGNRYNLRNADRLYNISCRTESFKSSFFPTSTAFWNNLDENLKSIHDRSSFKNSIVKKKPTKNKYYFLGPRTTNIIMARLRAQRPPLQSTRFRY